jgi:hypothetical protein
LTLQHSGSPEPNVEPRTPPPSAVHRLRNVVRGLDLACDCRSKLDGALRRFEAMEGRRELTRLIRDARHRTEQLAALLDLAREMDELTAEEKDLTVFEEIALLFESMEQAAARGAADMRAAGQVQVPTRDDRK